MQFSKSYTKLIIWRATGYGSKCPRSRRVPHVRQVASPGRSCRPAPHRHRHRPAFRLPPARRFVQYIQSTAIKHLQASYPNNAQWLQIPFFQNKQKHRFRLFPKQPAQNHRPRHPTISQFPENQKINVV